MSSGSTDRLVLARVLRVLRSGPRRSLGQVIADQRKAADRAFLLVRAFYAISVGFLVVDMNAWPGLADTTSVDPQWPARWLASDNPRTGIMVIFALYGFGAFGAAAFPRVRALRALYAVGLLQYMAIINGFGKINHNFHGWLFVAGLFVALPGRRSDPRSTAHRQITLSVFWSAQVVVLFFYALTGLWKVVYAVHALWSPRVSAFQLDGFSLLVAGRLLETDQQTLLGESLIGVPVLGWLLFNGTMYLEAAGLIAVFRPRLHRLWGLGLVTFHLGTQLAMGFSFPQNVALVGLLLVCSPFAPDDVSAAEVLGDLPGVRFVVRRLAKRS